MKRIIAILLTLTMVFSFAACSSTTTGSSSEESAVSKFTPGSYTGEGTGFAGKLTATVTLTADKIESIVIEHSGETENIGTIAVDTMPKAMVEAQSTQVDIVASATVTSSGIIEAVNAALVSAGVDPATLTPTATEAVEKTAETLDVDLVVIGAGGAGMSAAIKAKQAGLNVIIVEKMPMIGGNTIKATGGMNAAETYVQAAEGIEDTVQTFIDDTMTGGYNVNNPELVAILAQRSSQALEWLKEIDAELPEVSYSGGATNKRIHRPEGGEAVGTYLVAAFEKKLAEMEIPVYLDTTATEIVLTEGVASGIKANSSTVDYTVNAKAVILATGGFGANEELFTTYKPELAGYVTTNTPGATGDGIVMAQTVGANLVDIEQIQIHPTVEQTTSIMITESVRGGGAILVNQGGVRFTNELLTRDVVSQAIIDQEGNYAYLIFDQKVRDGLSAIEKYISAGIVEEAATIEELAEIISIDPTTLAETLATWNEAVNAGADVAFERTTGMENDLSTAPYYAIKIAPGVHHTMGGVEINTSAEVINVDGDVIAGLFAAGEVVGGVHGANRIGGNAVTDIIVFGTLSAESAIAYCAA